MTLENTYNVTIIGPATHPRDGMPGVAVKFNATGIESLYSGGVFRGLPRSWRSSQPAANSNLMPWARTMTATVS